MKSAKTLLVPLLIIVSSMAGCIDGEMVDASEYEDKITEFEEAIELQNQTTNQEKNLGYDLRDNISLASQVIQVHAEQIAILEAYRDSILMQLENNNTSAELTAQIEKTNLCLNVMQSQKSFLESLRKSQRENLSIMLNMTADELNEYLNPDFVLIPFTEINKWKFQAIYIDFSYADLSNADLSDAFLGGKDLRSANLSHVNLTNADLRNADLRFADLRNADLRNADLRNADLRFADLSNADLSNADLSNADLSDVVLNHANGNYANFSNAILERFYVFNTSLNNANFSNSEMFGANFHSSDLSNGDWSHANLAFAKFFAVGIMRTNLSNALLWQTNIESSTMDYSDLSNADMSDAIVYGETVSLLDVIWSNTTCPDGTKSNDNGDTCVNTLAAYD